MDSPHRSSLKSFLVPAPAIGLLLGLACLLIQASCAQRDPEDFDRDDYFGGQGNMINAQHHVPRPIQRVEPWWAIF